VVENIVFQVQTPRLRLKGLTTTDGEALFRYRSCPEVTQFQGWAPTSVEDALRFIENEICPVMDTPDTWFQLGIFLREENILIGDLGIHFLPEASTVEIGVTIAPEFQGNGYASEALLHVLGFLFRTLGKHKVIASVDPKNHKSMALMKSVGFQLDGIYKNAVKFRGEWADDAVFIMTRANWQTINKID